MTTHVCHKAVTQFTPIIPAFASQVLSVFIVLLTTLITTMPYWVNSLVLHWSGDARLIVPEEHETNPLDQLDPSLLDPQEPHHTPDSHPSAVKATFQSRLTVLCKELIHRFSGCGIWSHSDAQEASTPPPPPPPPSSSSLKILPSQLHLE